jgi:hypothetical protein
MKRLIILILTFILAFEWRDSAHAQDIGLSPRVQQQLEAMLAESKARTQKERVDCAAKLDMPIAPNNTEELVDRYGLDKAKDFNDCMIDESGVFWSMGRAWLERRSQR